MGYQDDIYNIQTEALEAPNGLYYLPCTLCGRLYHVEKNVIAITCKKCEGYDKP